MSIMNDGAIERLMGRIRENIDSDGIVLTELKNALVQANKEGKHEVGAALMARAEHYTQE